MDRRTQTIRFYVDRKLTISNQNGKEVKPGAPLVLRNYDAKDESQPIVLNGKKIENAKSKRCVSTLNNENKDNVLLNLWPCLGKDTQEWNLVVVPGKYRDLCKNVTVKGKRYERCPGKPDRYLGLHCLRHVENKKGKEVLVKKCGDKTWEVAKCHRFQQKGQWFRQCGEDHLERVANGGHQHSSK
jgi:hypothetical protein